MADAPKSAGSGEAGAPAPALKVVKPVHILKAGPKVGRLALRPKAGPKGGGGGHVHGPDCNHGPSDAHAHGPDCDHGPDGHGPRRERPHGTRTAETGGQACQLDLEFLLPGETDEAGRFAKLEHALESHRGITDAHLRRDGAHLEVCVHYDAAVVSLTQVLALVRGAGNDVAERYRTRTWLVRGMNSVQCAAIIEHALRRAPGVLSANVSYAAERVVIEYDTRVLKERVLERRLEVLGYNLEAPSHGHVCAFHGAKSGLAPRLEMPLVVSAGLLILTAFVLERTGVVATSGFTPASALYLLALAAAGAFPARGAFQALRQLRLDVESLVVLAAIAAPVLGMWGEGAFLLFLFGLGHAFEHRALERARRAIEALGKLRPEVARVRRGEAWVEVAVRDVLRGERVAVRPGDRVPLDGVIREGRSAFDQAAVTGESVPVDKGPGDEVWAGTISVTASFELEVTRRASESVLARVVDLVADAEAQKSPTQRFAQRVERRFVPIVLLAVLALPFILWALGTPLSEGIARALAVLVAATPCALAIATPAAVLAAVGRAARSGVLIKGGAHLEALGQARTVAFDKTGTLTIGRPRVVALLPEAGVSEDELLAVAAGLEAHSTHPLARAIMDAAGERALTSLPVAQVEAIHGKGLKAEHAGEALSVGNRVLFDGVFPEAMQGALQAQEALGRTTMIVRRGERWLGVIAVADTLRPEAKGALAALKAMGITKTVMLSGDQRAVARAIADEVGITDPRAPLMPEGKVAVLQELAHEGGVVMVGDGVNDAPALAAASVGIAMGGAGSDAAIETADVVLMGDDLNKLPFAIALARRASRTIRQNVIVALGVAVVLVVASIAGWTGIGEAVVLHEGSTVVVVLNGLWLLRFKQRPAAGALAEGPGG